jgi:hypothetical protein
MSAPTTPAWHARGLMFENCSCQLVCPGHMHFSNACTHERCVGYWAIRIDEGQFGEVPLSGLKAFIAEAASPEQRVALDTILTGRAGGSWALLAKFVSRWLGTRFLPIEFFEEDRTKGARIPGLLDTSITEIKGRDRSQPVTFENIFNQIHGSTQVIALGQTQYDDGVIAIRTEKSHGLHSRFEWAVA